MTVPNGAFVLPVLIGLGFGILFGWLWYRHKFKAVRNKKTILEDPRALLNELNKHHKVMDHTSEFSFGVKTNEETGKEELTIDKSPEKEPKKLPAPVSKKPGVRKKPDGKRKSKNKNKD